MDGCLAVSHQTFRGGHIWRIRKHKGTLSNREGP